MFVTLHAVSCQRFLPQVRAQALKILSHCLQLVRSVPRSDANIFPEYVLPSLSWLTQDQEDIVRIAYITENIASLAETALKFLEMAQLDYACLLYTSPSPRDA